MTIAEATVRLSIPAQGMSLEELETRIGQLVKHPEASVRVFLLGDGVQCAVAGQETHEGYYNIERMMASLARRGEVAT